MEGIRAAALPQSSCRLRVLRYATDSASPISYLPTGMPGRATALRIRSSNLKRISRWRPCATCANVCLVNRMLQRATMVTPLNMY